jgi:hypothetical protein
MLPASAAVDVSWEAAAAWRAQRHRLDARVPRGSALDVVSALCGLHAQVMSSAELSLWARVAGLRPDDVARWLWEEKSLVKQWAMRGTLHLVPAAELGLWHGALGTYDHWLKPSWFKGFGTTRDEMEALIAGVSEALAGRCLTREQLAAELGEARLGESWGAYLKPVAFRGQLCFGPDAGRNVTFTRPDTWLGAPVEAWDGEAALDEVARRFLHAYAPATADDFRRWWAISEPRARRRLQRLDVAEVSVAGERALVLAEDADALAAAEPDETVRLLPGFDPWVIGATRHSDRLMPDPSFRDRVHRPQGWVSPVLTAGGRILGTWRHERRGAALRVAVSPFAAVDDAVRTALAGEVDRLAAFLGAPDLHLDWIAG